MKPRLMTRALNQMWGSRHRVTELPARKTIPNGRRIYAECMTTSPIQESTGPGGAVVSSTCLVNSARVSCGVPAASFATSLATSLSKLNPAAMNLPKNFLRSRQNMSMSRLRVAVEQTC